MAGGDGPEGDDQTEAPTQRRLDRARDEGNVPLSKELQTFTALFAATLAGYLALPALSDTWLRAMRAVLEANDPDAGIAAGHALLRVAGLGILPVLLAVTVMGVLGTLGQVGLLLRPESLLPDLARLSPLAALKRLFGMDGLLELLRTFLKLAVVGVALWVSVDVVALQAALGQAPRQMLAALGRETLHLLLVTLGAFAVLAALDVILVRWRRIQRLRMSRQDLREEARDTDGDPQIKARLRRLRESRARKRMMAAVPKAAVVITNPTHYAVALAYTPGQAAAPRLVAKGADAMAARIRAVAEEHGVPIVANPPLARALFRLETDTEIPAEHWQAVAEIIAYVWGLRGRG